jgi:hypothetical protein
VFQLNGVARKSVFFSSRIFLTSVAMKIAACLKGTLLGMTI